MAACYLLTGLPSTPSTTSSHPISPPVTPPSMQPQSMGSFPLDYLPRIGMGNISMLLYIVILRAHNNHIVVVLQLLSYHLHIISGAFT